MAKKKLKDQLSNVDNQNINKAATPKESGGLSPTTLPTLGSEDNNTPRALYGTRPEGNELGLQNKPGGETDITKPIEEENDLTSNTIDDVVTKKPDDLNMYDDAGNVIGHRSQEAYDEMMVNKGIADIEASKGPQLIDSIVGSDQWSSEYVNIYNMLDVDQQEKIKQLSEQYGEDAEKAIKAQTEYMQKWQEEKNFRTSQENKRNEINELTGEVTQIQASSRIRTAEKQLKNLKSNIAYLGTMGAPGKSATAIDAIADQITEANRTYEDMVSIENKLARARDIGDYSAAEAFERQMEYLQDDLDSKVNETIQNAYNKFNNADMQGFLDDEKKLDGFIQDMMIKIDDDISSIAGVNAQQRKLIIDEANIKRERQQEYKANAGTINTDLSGANGFYYNMNGEPMYGSDGNKIAFPKDAPLDPIYDTKTGKLITFTTGIDGKPVASVTQVIDEPVFTKTVIDGIVANIANGTMTPEVAMKLVPGIENNQAFQEAIAAAEFKQPTTDTQDWSISGGVMYNKRTGEHKNVSATESVGGGWQKLDEETLYNKNTGEFKNRGTEDEYKGKKYNSTTEEVKQNGLDEFITNNATGTAGGQCGAFANDYLQSIGVGRIFTDPITQKKAQINSDSPTVGSVAIMDSPIAPEYGHVVVVTGINDDGTINVIESNMSGNETISERTMKTDNISGYFDPSISYEQAKEGTTGAATEGMQFKDELIPMYKEFYKSGKLTSTTIKSIEKTQTMEEFYKEALEYSKSNITGHYDKAKEIKDKAEKLKGLGRLARMGSTLPGSNLIPGLADLDAAFDTFKSQLSLKNLVDLKSEGATFGALSDNELQFITDAATALRRDLSDDKWESELEYIIDKMDKVVSKAETDMEEYGMIEKQKGRERFGYDGSKSGTLPTGNETAEPQSEDYDAIFESDNMDLESDGR